MAESVDARGLNPRVGQTACGFESHFGHKSSAALHGALVHDNCSFVAG